MAAYFVLEVDPPSPTSDLAYFHVIEYVRLPAMLKLFEETAGFPIDRLVQREEIFPQPMPLESHKTVIDYAKFIGETWGKSTITIRIPIPNSLSAMFRDMQTVRLQYADLQQRWVESQADIQKSQAEIQKLNKQVNFKGVEIRGLKNSANKREAESLSTISNLREEFKAMETRMNDRFRTRTEDSIRRDDNQFKICRGNLLMDLIKKLLPKEAEKGGSRPTSTRWSTMAENYAEADFKRATQNFDVCNDSAQMMHVFQKFGTYVKERNEAAHESQVEMARLLTSSTYLVKPKTQFWCHLFEYVYQETVDEAVQRGKQGQGRP